MSSIATPYQHIVVAEVMAYGWSPEELHFQHPYLSMGQIHSALAYYWDHEEEINQQIEDDFQYAAECAGQPESRRFSRT
jgi:hypothetical protein